MVKTTDQKLEALKSAAYNVATEGTESEGQARKHMLELFNSFSDLYGSGRIFAYQKDLTYWHYNPVYQMRQLRES